MPFDSRIGSPANSLKGSYISWSTIGDSTFSLTSNESFNIPPAVSQAIKSKIEETLSDKIENNFLDEFIKDKPIKNERKKLVSSGSRTPSPTFSAGTYQRPSETTQKIERRDSCTPKLVKSKNKEQDSYQVAKLRQISTSANKITRNKRNILIGNRNGTTVTKAPTRSRSGNLLRPGFPDFRELPKGLDPVFVEKREVTLNQCKKSNILFVDSVGYDPFVAKWIAKMQNSTNAVILENLQNPAEFNLYSKKSKISVIQLYVDDSGKELIVKSPKSTATISLMDVTEIKIGLKSKSFDFHLDNLPKEQLENAFTLTYGTQRELSVMAKKLHHTQLWVAGLIRIITSLKSEKTEITHLTHIFKDFGKPTLQPKEVAILLQKLNLKVANKEILEIVKSYDFNEDVTFEQLLVIIRQLRIRDQELLPLFNKYSDGNNFIKYEQIQKLLLEVEKDFEFSSTEILVEILNPFHTPGLGPKSSLSFEDFADFITSNNFNIFNSEMANVYQDMTRPLSDYFIHSSHNTYLEGNQLSGTSSAEMYIRVLKAGCRCVELDCWNGDNGEPIIFHGHTLTTRIPFEDAVKAISIYAFTASDYPVILSLENHCNVQQQTRMAQIMIQYFGKSIATPITGSNLKYLPSPEQLKRKILIKGKIDKIDLSETEGVVQKVTVAPELAAITYNVSTSFSSFEDFAANCKGPWEIVSFVETRLETLNTNDFIEFNKKNLSRIYPKGSRTMSSNYNPEPFWAAGCQLVALNLQTRGKVVWANEGKFRDNGGCGYLLKPHWMLFDHLPPSDNPYPIELTIEIISARQLPKPKKGDVLNPVVKVFVRGHPQDKQCDATNRVKANGFNPYWGKEMKFNINYPDLATLLFIILDDPESLTFQKKEKIAYYSIPLNCVNQGYRIMELFNEDGTRILMTDLFVRISIVNKV